MPRRRPPARPRRAKRSARGPLKVELQLVLDRLEAALLANQPERMAPFVGQLWHARTSAPAALVERLVAGRSRVPEFAFHLLGGFAGEALPEYLEQIYDDPRANDLVRWEARRRAAWPERHAAAARRAFLQSLGDADATLLRALALAHDSDPPDAAVLQEVLAYLAVLPATRRTALVKAALAQSDLELGWFMAAASHIPHPPLQRLLVDELVTRRYVGAAASLARLADTAADERVKAAARAAARRLQIAEVRPAGSRQGPRAERWPPLEAVLATPIDGDGGQALALVRGGGGGLRTVVHVFHNDGWGLKDAFGVTRDAEPDLVSNIAATFAERGLPMIEIDLPLARGILDEAAACNAAGGQPIPPAFEAWAPLFDDQFPPGPEQARVAPELDDAPYADRADLVRRSTELLDHPWFDAWFFDAADLDLASGRFGLRPGRDPSAAAYARIIAAVVDADRRARLRSRLRRQARLLEMVGDADARDLALAIAASLARIAAPALGRHPFLKAMVDRSLITRYQPLIW